MSAKSKERIRLNKLHGHKYKRLFLNEGYFCFYCADPASSLDHVPPLSSMDNLDYDYRKKHSIPCALLPCCMDCNAALGDRKLFTAMERLQYLESYYEAKLMKQRKLWSDDEIEELGGSLKDYVRARQEKISRFMYKIRAIQMRQIRPETFPAMSENNFE